MEGCTKTETTTKPNLGSEVLVKREVILENEHDPSSSSDERGGSQCISGAWTPPTFPKIKEEIESDSSSSDDDLEMNNHCTSSTSIPDNLPKMKEEIKDEPKGFGIQEHFQDNSDLFTTSTVVFKTINKREYNDYPSEDEPCFENSDLRMTIKYDQTQSSPSVRDRQSVDKEKINCFVTQSMKTNRKCELCGKVFSKKGNLSIHRSSVHSEVRPYKCNVCGRALKRKGDLNKHSKLHDKEKLLKCKFCDECFTLKSELNKHTRTTHREQRQFECKLCGKSCRVKSLFVIHTKKHTDERPFICECCGKGFKWKADLKRHKQYVNCKKRPFKCEFCDMCFRFNVTRIEHMRIHS